MPAFTQPSVDLRRLGPLIQVNIAVTAAAEHSAHRQW
jgi:hypothetical protein